MLYQAPITPFDGCGGGQTRSDSSRVYYEHGRCLQSYPARKDTCFNSSISMAATKAHSNPRSTIHPCFSIVPDDCCSPEAVSPPPAYAPVDNLAYSSQNILEYPAGVSALDDLSRIADRDYGYMIRLQDPQRTEAIGLHPPTTLRLSTPPMGTAAIIL